MHQLSLLDHVPLPEVSPAAPLPAPVAAAVRATDDPSALPLRDYQAEALAKVHAAYQRGVTRQLVALPTGAGKTICVAHLVRQLGWRAVMLVHRDELVTQSVEKLRAVNPGLRVGVVKADLNEVWADVIVASVQTVERTPRLNALHQRLARPLLLISDECFPSTTLIDGRPIAQVRTGDLVTAFDEHTGRLARARVLRTMRRPAPRHMVRISAGGHEVVCTPEHPFLTVTRGWQPAHAVQTGEEVYLDGSCPDGRVLAVWPGAHPSQQGPARSIPENRTGVLLGRLQVGIPAGGSGGTDGRHEQAPCRCTDEGAQPHGTTGVAREDARHAEGDRTSPTRAGWQWEGTHRPAVAPGPGTGVGYRGDRADGTATGERGTPAVALQTRHCGSSPQGRDRGGRRLARDAGAAGAGREEDRIPVVARVDRVEVLKPGRDGTFGGVCPDGHVYNLEVEGLHTYVANGFVVHNCHHDAAVSRTRIITALAPDLLVGVTATPDRADGKGLGRIYQEVVYSLSMIELMARGRLARLRGLRIDTGDSLDAVATRAGEFAQDQLEQAVNTPSRNDLVVRTWLEYARDRTRTVAFTVDVRHAHDLAAAFGAAGIAARAVSGATPADERRATLAAFHAGDIPVLTNCNVLTEGWDEPATDCILMTRPTKSRALYTQMVGRGARRAAGKSDCLIIDYCDSTSRHQLVTLPSLADDPLKQGPEKGSSPRVVGDRRRDGEQIDLLDFAIEREAVAASVNLLSTGAFTWQSLGPGVHVASAGNRCWIALHATAAGTVPYWVEQDAATWGYRREPLFDRPLDAEMALGLAEDQALKRGAAPHLVRRDAPWRQRASNERPTAAQINAAQRARIRLTGTESKHEIGVLLDEHFSRRALHAVGLLEGTKR